MATEKEFMKIIMFPTFDIFCQVMDQCTEDYNCLVINNNAKSNKVERGAGVFGIRPRPMKILVGNSEFGEFRLKRKTPQITMKKTTGLIQMPTEKRVPKLMLIKIYVK